MKHLFCSVVIAFCVAFSFSAEATPQPSFDCSKATAPIEKLVCSDDNLATKDEELGNLWKTTLQAYSGNQRNSLIKGQKNWLSLRSDACFAEEDKSETAAQAKCLNSVYEQRIDSLKRQLEAHKESPNADFDRILDAPITDSYIGLGTLYYTLEHGFDFSASREPKTCRELYTYRSGNWSYSADTIGVDAETFSLSSCAFNVLLGFNRPHSFSLPKSEMKKEARKALNLIKDEAEYHDIAKYIDNIPKIDFGDFTHKNRDEVLAIVYSHSSGTLKFDSVYLGYYDPTKKALIFEQLNELSPFSIVTTKSK